MEDNLMSEWGLAGVPEAMHINEEELWGNSEACRVYKKRENLEQNLRIDSCLELRHYMGPSAVVVVMKISICGSLSPGFCGSGFGWGDSWVCDH